ncbi:MAG: DUF1987 domain-containing protein, partial [Flavobacteriales bacterium]
ASINTAVLIGQGCATGIRMQVGRSLGSTGKPRRNMANKRFHIDKTETSPQIDLDLDNGVMDFIGRSLPHNSEQFYSRVYHWLEEYLNEPKGETTVNMKLDYLDTSSSKHLYNIFQKLDAVSERGQKVQVNWHYESGDDEMAETGKDYQSFFGMDFRFIEVQELF